MTYLAILALLIPLFVALNGLSTKLDSYGERK